jgi:glycosyltransferase involved in cell wall biosynthesis
LVPRYNEAAAAHELVRLVNDREARRELGREAQEYALTEFAWPVVAEKYLEVYQDTRNAA